MVMQWTKPCQPPWKKRPSIIPLRKLVKDVKCLHVHGNDMDMVTKMCFIALTVIAQDINKEKLLLGSLFICH